MKAVVVEKPGVLSVAEVPEPEITDYQALVRTLACSICNGTDSKILHGTIPFFTPADYPGILGHESVGRIVKLGKKVKHLQEGDLVFRPGAAVGGFNSFWGGFAEFGTVTDNKALAEDPEAPARHPRNPAQQVIPYEVNVNEATVCITLKEILSYLHALVVRPATSLLVLGYGPVGLTAIYLAKLIGANPVIVAGRRPEGLQQAMSFGADATVDLTAGPIARQVREIAPDGVDFIMDGIGKAALVDQAAKALKPTGKIGLYALVDRCDDAPAKDDRVSPAMPDEHLAHDEVLHLWKNGRIQPDKFITHYLPMSEIKAGFELVESKKAIKVVMSISD